MPQTIHPEKSFGKYPLEKAWVMSRQLLEWLDEQHRKGLRSLVFYPGSIQWDALSGRISTEVKIFDQEADLPPAYISPEETGRIAALPDYRSDYYRLGIIWYELFTGQPPFSGGDPLHVVWQHLAENPPDPAIFNPRLGAAASAIITKLLAKNQADRYQSAESILHDWEKAYELQENGNVAEIFELGTTDFPKYFSFPEELIGRDEEMREALACVKALSQQPRRGLLWIEGAEGSGKTFFIQQLENKIKQENQVVLHSSFRDDATLPYNSIKLVFEQLCVMLLNGPEASRERQKLQLEDALGSNVNVLTGFVPVWAELFGKSPDAPSLGAQETQNRLAYVLISVLAAFAKPGQSINIVMEDIHLAPPQTLRLLSILLDEPQLRYCLLILTSRSDTTPAYAELNTWLESVVSNKGIELSRTRFNPLQADAVARFFARSGFDSGFIGELAETVVRKTGGVPFFIRQLMESAASSGFLVPDAGKKIWSVNQKSFAALDITENMVAYLHRKILLLPADAKRFLHAASTIGISFNLDLLSAVLTSFSHDNITHTARLLHRLEIIVPETEAAVYRFSNQQLFQLVQNTSDEEEKRQDCSLISEYLYKQGFYQQSDAALYRLLGYIQYIPQPLPAVYRPLLESGAAKAEAAGAFDAALRYFDMLLGISDDNTQHPEFFYWQCKKLSMLVFSLRFDEYAAQRRIILESTKDVLQVAELDLIECKALMLQQDFPGAVRYAIKSLRRLGVFFSEKPGVLRIIYYLYRLKMMMRNKSVAFIENLPVADDKRTQYIVDILQCTSSAFFFIAPRSLTEVNAWQIRSTFQMGLSSTMGQVFASYGFILSSISHDFKKAEEMMTLARNLDTRFGNVSGAVATRFIHYTLTRHWHYPLIENATLLEENYTLSRDVGAIQIAFYSLATSDIFKVFSGISLNQIKQDAHVHLAACTEKHQLMMVTYLRMVLQFCDDAGGAFPPEKLMDGMLFSADRERADFVRNNYHTNLAILSSLEGLQGVIFQQYQHAENQLPGLLEQLSPVGYSSVSLLQSIIFQTIRAYKSGIKPNRHMRSARSYIRSWAHDAPFNFAVWHHILEAIISRADGKDENALYQLEKAVFYARKYGILHAEAIACEEKALLLAQIQPGMDIMPMMLSTWQLYHKWGAFARCAQLESLYPGLASLKKEDKSSGHDVNILSLLRASNSIAGEIRWESLLEKLTTILIENAGAQTAQILLPGPAGFQQVARKEGKEAVMFMQLPVNETTHPVTMLRAVWRSLQPEVVSDASQDNHWANDPYFQHQKTLSVLCMPVVKNQGLAAILYLENNLTSGAFNRERLDLVQMLSGQIAVSLENARLYDELESRVDERTRQLQEKNIEVENQKKKVENTLSELQAAQAQLIQSEKMASLGELTAGIAHEIQNPLNFVNNFSEVSNELIDEMIEELVKGNLSEVSAIASDIRQNLDKIKHHGKRADAIVKGMLLHSRISSGAKELTHINALADEYLRLAYHGLRAKDKSFNVTLKADFDENAGKIGIIPQDIGRVILNLLTNAFYAVTEKKQQNIPGYEPTVTVSTRKSGGKVEIKVEDNGNGIPAKVLDKIYQPFFSTKPSGQGTGLGLSMSYEIVTKSHGGELRVETKEGEGAAFTIVLPV